MKKRFLSILLVLLFVFPCFAISAEEWCEISLPSKLYGVVGNEINVYFDNVIMCNDLSDYHIIVECDKGDKEKDRWTYTPEAAESFTLKIRVLKNGTDEVSSAQTTVQIFDTEGTGDTKKVLCIGDSWTEGNSYIHYCRANFENDKNDVKFLGSKDPWNGGLVVHEGRSGWTTQSYCTMSSYKNQNNPFYNNGKFDFKYYLETSSIEDPDIVVIFLGINDAGQGITTEQSIEYFNTMINSIHSYSKDIEIGIVLTPPPGGTQDGFGKINLCGTTRFRHKYNAFNLTKALINAYDGGKVDNVSTVPVNVNIDCINKYKTEEVPANAYTQVTVRRLVDNVHPDYAGYREVGNSLYAYIKSFF